MYAVKTQTYQGESTVSTHTVTGDADTAGIQLGESIENSLGQFFSDIAVHVIAVVVGRLCGVNVETGSRAEVVCIIFALDVQAALRSQFMI